MLRLVASTAVLGVALIAATGLGLAAVWSRPAQGIARFHNYYLDSDEAAIAEDEWADPLILTGRGAVPSILAEVTNRSMPRRHYAIWYLGLSGDRRSLPVLETILNDVTESEYARADALVAIAMIDEAQGLALARRYESHEGIAVIRRMEQTTYLGRSADELLYMHNLPDLRRSYLDALRGRIGVELRL